MKWELLFSAVLGVVAMVCVTVLVALDKTPTELIAMITAGSVIVTQILTSGRVNRNVDDVKAATKEVDTKVNGHLTALLAAQGAPPVEDEKS